MTQKHIKEEEHAEIIQFSGGKTSAMMTYLLTREDPDKYLVLFQNTGKEMPATLDFVNECDKRWGLNVVWLEYRFGHNYEVVDYETASRTGRPFEELLAHKKYFLPNIRMRYCTDQLKIQTARRYLQSIGVKEWTAYIGIRYDEKRRWSKTQNLPNYMEVDHPLVRMKITEQDVFDFWDKQDFKLMLNEPYGNCDCCFLKGKGKVAIIAKEKPELLDWWIKMEKRSSEIYDQDSVFRKTMSFEQFKQKALSQPGLFDGDPSFHCFCNVD